MPWATGGGSAAAAIGGEGPPSPAELLELKEMSVFFVKQNEERVAYLYVIYTS